MIDLQRLREEQEDYVAELASINLQHLDSVMQNHAAVYGYALARYERLEVEASEAEEQVDTIEAQVFNEIQEQEPGLAIGRTERRVEADPRVTEAKSEAAAVRKEARLHRALVDALDKKTFMLTQLSKRQAAEARQYAAPDH